MLKECKCNGLKIFSDLVSLYSELEQTPMFLREPKSTQKQKQQAYELTGKLLKLVSEKDFHSLSTEANSYHTKKKWLELAKTQYIRCTENRNEDCLFALEGIRTIIHNDAGVRAKLLCDTDIYSSENYYLKEIMNMLRGTVSGRQPKQIAKKMIEDYYKEITCTKESLH